MPAEKISRDTAGRRGSSASHGTECRSHSDSRLKGSSLEAAVLQGLVRQIISVRAGVTIMNVDTASPCLGVPNGSAFRIFIGGDC